MKRLARLAGAMALAVLSACETTGNPREGGLFGWSESKARERQAEKISRIAGAEARRTQETAQGEALQARGAAAERNLTAAEKQRIRSEKVRRNQQARLVEERLQAQQLRLVAKAEQLETDSPTAATASRARSYRREVIATQTLPQQQRTERLHAVEAEIDAARARLTREP